ncbi:MAG TPA: hypothetical protein DCW90_03600 [Lachnospiraceae bacterium]|nr:hypothetical protein [Lachnospiraceae bacterium]
MSETSEQYKRKTEEWLDERWRIVNMTNPPRQADLSYYEGALKAIEFLGYDWERTGEGKHIIYKRK